MTAFLFGSPSAPSQINANGQDVVDVLMHLWGSNVKDCYPPVFAADGITALNEPGFRFSPQAIMIGPRSQIDRCFVSWNLQARTAVQTRSMVRVLSLDAPLLWPQTAGNGGITTATADPVIATAQSNGLLYVTPHVFPTGVTEVANPGSGVDEGYMSTLIPTQHLKADGTLINFVGQAPVLHLQFHLKAAALAQPVKRFPYLNAFRQSVLDPNVEEAMVAWPVFGRKTIALQVASSIAGTNIRIGALRNVNRNYRLQETTEGDQQVSANNQSIRFRFCDLAADYLILYATAPLGASRVINATIAAYD